MTITTKVEGRAYADLSAWGKRFDKRAMKEMAGYLSSGNMGVSQALAFAAADPATTGTKLIMIDGHVIVCIAEANADWSETTAATVVAGDAKDVALETTDSSWILTYARLTGLLRIDLAGTVDTDAAVLAEGVIVPKFDSSTWAPIALTLVTASSAVTLGTTDINSMVTIHQLLSPILPDPSVFAN